MSYLIDTDWVIDALANTPEARRLFATLRPAGLSISIITYLEVIEGILGGRDSVAAEAGFAAFLEGTSILSLTQAEARRTADIRIVLRQQRRPIAHRFAGK